MTATATPTRPVGALRSHPANEQLYGDAETVEDLVEAIGKSGWVRPLAITADGIVISGHRRLSAARQLGLREVPVEVLELEGDDLLERLLNENKTREKTETQRAREERMWGEIAERRARARRLEGNARGGAANPASRVTQSHTTSEAPPQLPAKPKPLRATDEAATLSGCGSGRTYERRQQALSHIETLEAEGRRKEAKAVERAFDTEGAVSALRLAKLEPELRAKAIEIIHERPEIPSKQAVAQAKREIIVERAEDEVKSAPAPGLVHDLAAVAGRYRCIYADPPWRYENTTRTGAAEHHYPTMSNEDLARLPLGKLAHPEGAHLWLWTTWPMIRARAPHDLLDAWGYRWAGEITWDKQRIGTGSYIRSQCEVLILAVRGSLPMLAANQGGFYSEPRGAHSAKPEWFAHTVERLTPGPRIELFARAPRNQWDRWGLEAGAQPAKE